MPRRPHLVARDAALLRLRAAHPREYEKLYDEERVKNGVEPLAPRRRARIRAMEKKLKQLKDQA